MDMITCPYIPVKLKKTFIGRLLKQVKQFNPTPLEIDECLTKLSKFSWFTSWNGAELMTLLEKKELLKSY